MSSEILPEQPEWPHSLIYHRQPAGKWLEGLPIGNGTLAAMFLGAPHQTRLALNHEWLWRGVNRGRTVEPGHDRLPEIRRLFFENKPLEAGELANEILGGGGGRSGRPNRVDPYQPAGDLFIETDHQQTDGYLRQLDLDSALVRIAYQAGGSLFTCQGLAHSKFPMIALRFHSVGPLPWKARLRLDRIADPHCEVRLKAETNRLRLEGRFPEGIRFAISGELVLLDGHSTSSETALEFEAEEALLRLTAAVDLEDGDALAQSEALLQAHAKPWECLLASHGKHHQSLFRRVSIELGGIEPDLPTDRRLEAMRSGVDDEALLATYANFGRYLLISSSRPDGLPANLQGKWNEELMPPWKSDFHHDINLQMNYWPAEICGLTECLDPLFDHLERFRPGGREMARKLYDCSGICYCIQTDPWGHPTPESRGWDVWTGAAAWLAQHLWWRFEFDPNPDFLRQTAYPFIKEVAAFYQDYLVEDPRNGYLVTVPSQSPENSFVGGCEPVSLCVAATMDVELIHDLLGHAIQASEILECDPELRAVWRGILQQLPPLQIGRHGQLQEWMEDYEEAEPGHRHISHLFALFPGDQVTLEETPELAEACRVSLERRLSHGGAHTGWSRAWTACCYSRLQDAGATREHLRQLLIEQSSPSLLDLHPPGIFEIDGNFGGATAFLEMLLQSHNHLLRILPALPDQWPCGIVRGLRARGGFQVDIEWGQGRPLHVCVFSLAGQTCHLQYPGDVEPILSESGNELTPLNRSGNRIEFSTLPGRSYTLRFDPRENHSTPRKPSHSL